MAEDNGNWKVPTLTRLNYEKWFRLMEAKLEGKGVIHVVQQTLEQYAKVATPDSDAAAKNKDLEELINTLGRISISPTPDSSASSTPRPRIFLNVEKKAKFQKDTGIVKFYLLQGLDDDDQALMDEYKTPKALWEYLRVKYAQPSKLAAARYTKELHDFSWNDKFTVIDAWNKLKEIRRKIVAAKPSAKGQYDDESLLLILTSVLPDSFQSTVDTLNVQTHLTVDDQLKHLQNKEERLGLSSDNDKESGHAAHARGKGIRTKRTRNFFERRKSGSDVEMRGTHVICFFCEADHAAMNCPYREKVQKFVKQLKDKERQRRHRKRTPENQCCHRKNHGLAGVASDTNDPDSDPGGASNSDPDSESELEVAALTKEQKERAARKHPQSWPVDTGASSHMTDKLDLFRGPLRTLKRRKPIQVGGGILGSDHCGTAEVVAEDGSSCLLKNTLLVPKLGINLISARRLCKDGIEGHFDAENMYFKKDNKILIHAQQDNGLYLVKSISKDCLEKAFSALQDQSALEDEANTDDDGDPDESEEDETTRGQRRTYRLMHRRFGHYGSKILRHLHEVASGIKEIKIPPPHRRICEPCKIGKMRKKISKKLAQHKAEALALVSIDIAGPFVMSIRGYVYFLQIIDNYTRKVWTIPLKAKNEAIPKLQAWRLKQERKTGKKVIACRSDNAPELKEVMNAWEEKDGVTAEHTTIASSHQNGPAERAIQTTENATRTMTECAGLPAEFWCFAAETDAHVRNRLPGGPEIKGKRTSPEEAYTGIKQVSDYLRVWGCKCYVHVDPKTLPTKHLHNKQANRGKRAVFLGYSSDTNKQYWYYSADLGYAQRSSSIDFHEQVKGGTIDLRLRNLPSGVTGQGTSPDLMDRKPRGRPKGDKTSCNEESSTLTTRPVVEIPSAKLQLDLPSVPEEADKALDKETTKDMPIENRNQATVEDKMEAESKVPTPAQPYSPRIQGSVFQKNEMRGMEEALRKDNSLGLEPSSRYFFRTRKREDTDDEEERQAKRIRAMLALLAPEVESENEDEPVEFALAAMQQAHAHGKRTRKGVFERFYALLCRTYDHTSDYALPATVVQGIPIPRTYKEAMRSQYAKEWDAAVREEIKQLIQNGTWEEFVLPRGANLVSTKWVFTIKETANGKIERFKARLVARGFSQTYGTDYTETFAPTARMDTLRLFLAIVAKRDLECSHFDIKNAFTESHLKEDIFLAPPEGVTVTTGKALKALRSLYGLKQAGRDWNLLLRDFLTNQCKFEQSLADPCLFVHKTRKLYLLVYVDDIAAAAEDQTQIDWFSDVLSQRFNAKNLGEISKLLGVRITRDRKARTVYLDQEQYLDKVLLNYGIPTAKHKSKSTPAADYSTLRPATDAEERIDASQYQQIIGSLMYAMTLTRPDIAFVLGCLARYMSDPAVHHGHAVKELMRYLRSTIKQKLRFGPGGDKHFVIFTDADWASDKSDRKSVSGGVGMFYGGPFCWMSKNHLSPGHPNPPSNASQMWRRWASYLHRSPPKFVL